MTPSPASWDFGNQDIHSGGSPGETLTFTNDTADNVSVYSDTLVGTDPGEFQITADTCSAAFLLPIGFCTVQVSFVPNQTGEVTAALELDDDTGTLDVPLSGNGITGTLNADPDPLEFQSEPYYDGGEQQGITITDSDDAGTLATAGTITGPDASMFYIANGQNCADQLYQPGNQCGVNVGFNPPSYAGSFNADLEIDSDSLSGPLIIPLSATTLNGPQPVLTPAQISFGDVAVGAGESKTVTLANEGDAPMQIQEAFVVSGTPQAFPITADGCAGQIIYPGSSCQFTMEFEPATPGFGEGATLIIIGNTPGPVTPIGFTGTGVSSPAGTTTILGNPADGSRLTCKPVGYPGATSYSYQWLRNGHALRGATSAIYTPGVDDVGSRLSCRLSATDPVGEQTVTSPLSAPVAAMDLSRLSGSFVDEGACRTIAVTRRLLAGGDPVTLSYPQPSLPWAPLTVSARHRLSVGIDGRAVGTGRRIAISPGTLARYGDGEHTLSIETRAHRVQTSLLLAPCMLAVRVNGGPRTQGALVALASRDAVSGATITLPPGLRLDVGSGWLGQLSYQQAGYPARDFDVVGAHTSWNNVTVDVSTHTIRIRHLPALTGVVRFNINAGLLTGTGGIVQATATIRGAGGIVQATSTLTDAGNDPISRVPATWIP